MRHSSVSKPDFALRGLCQPSQRRGPWGSSWVVTEGGKFSAATLGTLPPELPRGPLRLVSAATVNADFSPVDLAPRVFFNFAFILHFRGRPQTSRPGAVSRPGACDGPHGGSSCHTRLERARILVRPAAGPRRERPGADPTTSFKRDAAGLSQAWAGRCQREPRAKPRVRPAGCPARNQSTLPKANEPGTEY